MAPESLAPILYPELRALAPAEWRAALRRARRTPFDMVELLGMAAGLIAAALFIRHGIASMLPEAAPIARAAIGAVALAGALGPFLVRRTRRALRETNPPGRMRA